MKAVLEYRSLFVLWITLALLSPANGFSQTTEEKPYCKDKAFHKEVDRLLEYTVQTIDCDDIVNDLENYLILDAREKEEFETSHIPGAVWVGYDRFKIHRVPEDDRPVVVYCSVGYRSEKIGEILQRKGYKEVFNLYGSIFEWANRNLPLCDNEDQPTRTVHTYNRAWSKWVNKDLSKVTW